MQNPFGNNDNDNNSGMFPLPSNFATVHNRDRNSIKIGKVGFSITALFFSFLPALFRRDWYNLACMVGLELIASIISALYFNLPLQTAASYVGQCSGFVWGFIYNMMYFRHLQKIGYVPSDPHSKSILEDSRYMKF